MGGGVSRCNALLVAACAWQPSPESGGRAPGNAAPSLLIAKFVSAGRKVATNFAIETDNSASSPSRTDGAGFSIIALAPFSHLGPLPHAYL